MHSVAPTPGRVPAAILAILVHILFFALLVYGIQWKTHAPEPVTVELWQPPPIAERSRPVVVPKPRVEEKIIKPAPPVQYPDIALAEKKRKRLEQKTQEAERLMLQQAQQKLAELKLKQQQEQQKQAEQKLAEQKQARLQKQVQQKILAQQQIEQQKIEQQKIEQQKIEQQKKQAAALRQMIAQQNQSAMKAESAQAMNNSRQAALASKQSAEQSTLRTEFKDKIKAKIRSKIILPDGLQGNPQARFEVLVLPTGEVVQVKLVHPSGQPAYDDAVERAIRKATPLPMPPDPSLVSEFRDLDLNFSPNEN